MAIINSFSVGHTCDPEYRKSCVRCNRSFVTPTRTQQYCSHSCKNCTASDKRFERKEARKLNRFPMPALSKLTDTSLNVADTKVNILAFMFEVHKLVKAKGISDTSPKEILDIINTAFTKKYTT